MSKETRLGATGTTFVRRFPWPCAPQACRGDETKTTAGIYFPCAQDGGSRVALRPFIFSLHVKDRKTSTTIPFDYFYLFVLLTRRLDAWTTTARSTFGYGCRTLRPALTSRRQDLVPLPATTGPIASSSRRPTTREENSSTRGSRRYVCGSRRFVRVSTGEGRFLSGVFLLFLGPTREQMHASPTPHDYSPCFLFFFFTFVRTGTLLTDNGSSTSSSRKQAIEPVREITKPNHRYQHLALATLPHTALNVPSCPYSPPPPTEPNAMSNRTGHNLANGRTARLGTTAAGGWPGLAGGGLRTGGVEGRRVGRRKDASAAVPRDQGRSVVGQVLGTAADVLRAVLDREQDGVGAQLPRQVSCLPRTYTRLSCPVGFGSVLARYVYTCLFRIFSSFISTLFHVFFCSCQFLLVKYCAFCWFSLPPTPSFMVLLFLGKARSGKNVTMSRTTRVYVVGDDEMHD